MPRRRWFSAVAGLYYDPQAMLAIREGQRIPLTRLQGLALATALLGANHPNVSTPPVAAAGRWGDEGGDLPAPDPGLRTARAGRPPVRARDDPVGARVGRLVALP